ncbi:TldD/PmbA family protein [Streptomyces sp. NPDC001595]|uniref:TldD/PmbA family protein n=1 Tax=Streptomyces sp. NPDC001532 TaxID=3154520 RepID=UPI003323DE91
MTPDDLADLALARSRAAHCTVVVDDTAAAWLRWSGDDLTANGSSTGRRVTVVAAVERAGGTAVGTYTAPAGTPAEVTEAVRTAEAMAERAEPDPEAPAPLTPADTGAPGPAPAHAGPHPAEDAPPDLPVAALAALRGPALSGYTRHHRTATLLATSTGLRRHHLQPTATLELCARDGVRSAWAAYAAGDFADLDPAALEAATAGPLARTLPRRALPPGRYEVLLPPAAVADLMITAYRALGAADAVQGRTVFGRPGGGTRLGERLTPQPLTLRADPAEPGLESCPFVLSRGEVSDVFGGAAGAGSSAADNGLPLGPVDWIRDGVLTSLLTSRREAAALGLPVRPAVGNLVLEGGPDARTLPEMVRDTRRGLLLTCLWYMRPTDAATLTLTGLTRDGVHLVENGEITAEVDDVRFAESPLSLLSRATETGRTERTLAREFGTHFPRTAMPTLRIPDFHITGTAPR